MEKEKPQDSNNSKKQGQEDSYDPLLRKEIFIPMDTNNPLTSQNLIEHDNVSSAIFTRDKVFKAVSQGDAAQLQGLLHYLQTNDKKLTSPDFIDETNGKTALLKALLNLKDGKNDTIEVLLDIAEKTRDLKELINASYTDPCYKGQTALHVAIERRSLDLVKLLVQKGADVQAKAEGTFFQNNGEMGFYFGELPLSLAACTNQPDIVSFLMENPENPDRRADLTDKDSEGNTVLHVLIIVADDSNETTEMISKIYDDILVKHYKIEENSRIQLEDIENNQGLTPLKLAAKLGKIGLFRHMLNREFIDEETRPLSRKFTECVYGPVHSSLYDISSIDTSESNSVLEIIVHGNNIPNRPEMIKLEPLRSLLQDKWERFGAKLFLLNFLCYLMYLAIFTTVAFYRKEGQPPFPVENHPSDHLRCVGELISVFGAVRFFYKAITIFHKKPPNLHLLFTDGVSEILFFLQAALLLCCTLLYFCGRREYVSLLVLSLALAWTNVLYYTRGSKQLGMYHVMMQRMILGDLFHFLFVYCVLLFGFSAAVVTLMDNSPTSHNDTHPRARSFVLCEKPSYNDIGFTTLELFKFTIGMGDLEFTDQVQYKEVFYILLICYIILTYILMLNMLIALMGNTVERISEQSETIWNLQRAFTILDMEKALLLKLSNKIQCKVSKKVHSRSGKGRNHKFVRVSEINWKKWRSDLGFKLEEETENETSSETNKGESGTPWSINGFFQRIRSRRGRQQQNTVV
ncbi:transient receptor potential cation channel subfamily V member 1 [Oryzias melastigma]|uniref:Transient receptor potential cation channel subfamily V member 1-like n=1 Tax=Oryzias melastigma TaxID=30732 RepID=A0A3B3E229_ORYME|nr:transient receptor potential cation channel subfamily V member 1 [Oryzias melastigma]